MRYSFALFGLLSGVALSAPSDLEAKTAQLPLVIWHGLGDQFDSPGLQEVAEVANKINPGTFVHVIQLGADGNADRSASFFGRATAQVDHVCNQLAEIPELANGFNALGFSQGGQFLRAYVQRCNDPPVHTLITYGSQHNGITDFLPSCGTTDFMCKTAEALLSRAKFSPLVQGRLIPAQYYRDPEDLETYLEKSLFLADINNEREESRKLPSKKAYAWRLSTLRKFVMVAFEDDTTVVPKETAFFAEVNATSGEVTPLEKRPIYTEDWIGLKTLGEKGAIEYQTIAGDHMQLSKDILSSHFRKYLGPTSDPEFVYGANGERKGSEEEEGVGRDRADL